MLHLAFRTSFPKRPFSTCELIHIIHHVSRAFGAPYEADGIQGLHPCEPQSYNTQYISLDLAVPGQVASIALCD